MTFFALNVFAFETESKETHQFYLTTITAFHVPLGKHQLSGTQNHLIFVNRIDGLN